MSWIDGARTRLHLFFRRDAAERRFEQELEFHIGMETDRLVRGERLTPDEARRRALVTFGGVTRHKEELREGRGLAWLGGVSLDFKLATRMLVKNPGLTLVAVVGIAVAVAIATVSFSVIYTLVEGKLPLNEGERIVSIRNIDSRGGHDARATHLHDLVTWREALRTVKEVGAYRLVERNLITADGRAESVRIAEMTASGFRIARVPPLVGRYFNDDDERAGAAPVVIIGYDVWQTRLSARPDVVGQTLRLGDTQHTIVGVMPAGFAFPVNNRVWTPMRLNAADYERGRAPGIEVFGRLADGATIDDVRRQLLTIGQRLAAADSELHAFVRPRVIPYTRAFIDNPEATWVYSLIQLLVTMLLVVIGTNVAVLVYARTASRMGEIAIRTALGATRGRVVAQLFAEALAMSGIGAAIGLLGAHLALEQIDAAVERLRGEQLPFWLQFHITPVVVLYAVGLAAAAAVIVGVAPALKATRHQVRSHLQQLSAGSSRLRLGGTWTFLIVAQVALAVAVLPLAIAGVSAWKRIESAKSALANKQILTATLLLDRPELTGQRLARQRSVVGKIASLGGPAADSAGAAREMAARYVNLRAELVARLQAESGVVDVAFASSAPSEEPNTRVEVFGAVASKIDGDTTSVSGSEGFAVGASRVDAHFFDALEIPILAGRGFEAGDLAAPTTAVIVNRSFARRVLGGGNPLGRRIREVTTRGGRPDESAPATPWEEIVGVVPDFPVDSSTPAPKVYRPLPPTDVAPAMIAVRLKGLPAASFTKRLRELTIATSPMLRLEGIKTLEQSLDDNSAPTRLAVLAMELITLSTVLLSAAGIYALMSFTITRRRREIGIRSALGAGSARVLLSVFSRAFAQVVVGIAIGVTLAGILDGLLQGGWTGRRGAFGLAAVALLMAVVALIAAIGPANRALRISPLEALKAE